ncbi:MAG: hypothetical protein ACM3PU_02475 [Gemmatimonadota bacterium]
MALALCAFLLAQWSLAAHACPLVTPEVPTQSKVGLAASAVTDHCDHSRGAPPTLCYKHCNADNQALSALHTAFAAPPPALLIVGSTAAEPTTAVPPRLYTAHATAPPLTILYCVSLT